MKKEQLTFTRFIAAIAIVAFHYGRNAYPLDHKSLFYFIEKANLGVSYFFTLSGFVMIIAYWEKSNIDSWQYLKRRFARIYPVYFLSLALLYINFLLTNKYIDYQALALNIFFLQSWFPGKTLAFNFPAWSLSVEFFFYALFPLIFNRIYKTEKIKYYGIAIIIIWLVSQLFLHWFVYSKFYEGFPSKSFEFVFNFPLLHLNEFLIGSLAGIILMTRFNKYKKNYDWQVLLALVTVPIILKYYPNLLYENGLLAPLFAILIFLISINEGRLTTLFRWPALIFLGEISYGIYILQAPIFRYMKYVFPYIGINNSSAIFYISLLALIFVSAVSYMWIEKPLRKYISNLNFQLK